MPPKIGSSTLYDGSSAPATRTRTSCWLGEGAIDEYREAAVHVSASMGRGTTRWRVAPAASASISPGEIAISSVEIVEPGA